MPRMTQNNRNRPPHAVAFLICLSCCVLFTAACGSKSASGGKRYHLTGKVLSVAKEEGSATVDADDIPGFMSAMAMPYPIPDQKALADLTAGDEITADVVMTGDDKYHLENIVVTKKGDGTSQGPSTENLHQPQTGEKVPDFALVNQDGKTIHLDSFKGKVTLITFIYTRCPFADYCPLVSKNFAQIYAGMRANPALYSKVRLLSVSFDPAHDTPQVLRQYGSTFDATTGGNPFGRWEFATAPPKDLEKITQFFGVFYDPSQKEIVHSLSTSVISPQGTIYKWYSGNEWKPSDLLDDATKALAPAKAGTPGA
jgi:protein SCO1/2